MAMAEIEMLMAMNLLGLPGEVTFVVCGKALMISLKSSINALIVIRLTSVVVFVIHLKGSSCLSRSWA